MAHLQAENGEGLQIRGNRECTAQPVMDSQQRMVLQLLGWGTGLITTHCEKPGPQTQIDSLNRVWW